MMQLGEKYRVKTTFSLDGIVGAKSMVGTVVYIHPKGNYATLEFEGVNGKARECFFPEQLTENNLVREKKGKRR